ncbi:MAG: ABC transporter permease, partial [Candidatus Ranarchaeia archaeon]
PNPPLYLHINLTISATVRLTESARSLANPRQVISFFGLTLGDNQLASSNILLSDWNKTLAPLILRLANVSNARLSTLNHYFFVDLDRDNLISPYDIENSMSRVEQVINQIRNKVQPFGVDATDVNNRLATPLSSFQMMSQFLTFGFILNAVPVFFMAVYTGTMVSDVTFNLRRREIGLLITRGMNSKTIRNIFIFEAAFIGIIAGIAGNILGIMITPIMLGTSDTSSVLSIVALNPVTNVIAVIFSILLSILSVFRPARRASRLEALEALREYVYIEETSPYKKLLPYSALLLGSYKIIAWTIGLNIQDLILSIGFSNIIIIIFIGVWSVVDQALNYVGALLFLYGATKVLLRGSFKFQRLVVRTGKRILGEFGNLATRNVQRNPTRNAALVFIVALIVSFGFSTIGTLASTVDLETRRIYTDVGADVSLFVRYPNNVSTLLPEILAIEGVRNATAEYRFQGTSSVGSLSIRAVDPKSFLSIGYYENDWFLSNNATATFSLLTNDTIILSREAADSLDLVVGDSIAVTMEETGKTYNLEIIGIFGPKSPEIRIAGFQFNFFTGRYWSYVSTGLFETLALNRAIETKILVDVINGANVTSITQQIESLDKNVVSVDSVEQQQKEFTDNPMRSGVIKVQTVAVIFSGILTFAGTGLIVTMTLQEKRVELALMNVRGMKRHQLQKTLFAELLVLIFFSIILGVGTGIIQIYGNVISSSTSDFALLTPRMVLTPLEIIGMLTVIASVLVSVIVPVILAVRQADKDIDTLRR